ncbi:MAG: DUF2946 domain-containing protein [Tepidimonas sp.]|nr:DUF2946 domain-containing protein [Tepidimonas sp.]
MRGWLHQRLAWLALCAMVFGAFAPAISKVLAANAQRITWIEVCSTNGPQRIAVDLGSQTPADAPMVHDDHCGYCLLHHHTPVVPTEAYTWRAAVASTGPLLTGGDDTAVYRRFIRDAHPTRAPPALS